MKVETTVIYEINNYQCIMYNHDQRIGTVRLLKTVNRMDNNEKSKRG